MVPAENAIQGDIQTEFINEEFQGKSKHIFKKPLEPRTAREAKFVLMSGFQ